ncbi:MAG: hypothetical protein ACLUFV_13175 [Acutalibacteraceae bacterium]
MLANEKLDAVSVCTWNAEHKNAAIAALKGGPTSCAKSRWR